MSSFPGVLTDCVLSNQSTHWQEGEISLTPARNTSEFVFKVYANKSVEILQWCQNRAQELPQRREMQWNAIHYIWFTLAAASTSDSTFTVLLLLLLHSNTHTGHIRNLKDNYISLWVILKNHSSQCIFHEPLNAVSLMPLDSAHFVPRTKPGQ